LVAKRQNGGLRGTADRLTDKALEEADRSDY
jgi:hypothetical protein